MVRERSGGISLAKARLVLPLSRNTVEASETRVRAAKAKARFSFEAFQEPVFKRGSIRRYRKPATVNPVAFALGG
jgi:hypothetical protein